MLTTSILRRHPEYPHLIFYVGTQEEFTAHYAKNQGKPERIIASSIKHPDGKIYAADAPGRHHHCIALMSLHGVTGPGNTQNQGFITNTGRYVNRREGLAIAVAANQLIQKTNPPEILFSEDVW